MQFKKEVYKSLVEDAKTDGFLQAPLLKFEKSGGTVEKYNDYIECDTTADPTYGACFTHTPPIGQSGIVASGVTLWRCEFEFNKSGVASGTYVATVINDREPLNITSIFDTALFASGAKFAVYVDDSTGLYYQARPADGGNTNYYDHNIWGISNSI